MSRRKLCRLTPAQLQLLPGEINERTEGGSPVGWRPDHRQEVFAPVCRRKIILLHLLPSVAMPCLFRNRSKAAHSLLTLTKAGAPETRTWNQAGQNQDQPPTHEGIQGGTQPIRHTFRSLQSWQRICLSPKGWGRCRFPKAIRWRVRSRSIAASVQPRDRKEW
jgi:hypothetical protein